MGIGLGKLQFCFSGGGGGGGKKGVFVPTAPEEGLGHSFCYVRRESREPTIFKTISGASVSANASTPLSTTLMENNHLSPCFSAAFESSTSFASIPLQPVPRCSTSSSGPMERRFLSGPIERGFLSEPFEPGIHSSPLEKPQKIHFQNNGTVTAKDSNFIRSVIRATASVFPRSPRKRVGTERQSARHSIGNFNCQSSLDDCYFDGSSDSSGSENLHWAQGKAGEDRVHVVISEEHELVFMGIYDGFNGPDAPDFLLSNLYPSVHTELKGLLWNDIIESSPSTTTTTSSSFSNSNSRDVSPPSDDFDFPRKTTAKMKKWKSSRGILKRWEKCHRKWKSRSEVGGKTKQELRRKNLNDGDGQSVNHLDVLKALDQALRKTEESYLEIADQMVMENPELALMGSCVLVMLMKGDDVYVMNVGDSRAVLAQNNELDFRRRDLERITEETALHELNYREDRKPGLFSIQLTMDHSTNIEEEVDRMIREHPDDASTLINDRVKGSLKVTRAFGAGFLKHPKWNDALLEMFRIDYIGLSPYINCSPWLRHHKITAKDRFLILSSDGLYQFFTNQEAVSEVEAFITQFPDGDPAQHLIEELLFRAATRAGMDFYDLLEIPQGDRRRYHDDVSVIVISFEGRIWRSSLSTQEPSFRP